MYGIDSGVARKLLNCPSKHRAMTNFPILLRQITAGTVSSTGGDDEGDSARHGLRILFCAGNVDDVACRSAAE